MSKEEILDAVLAKQFGDIERSECLEAMTKYAKEIAIGFADWLLRGRWLAGITSWHRQTGDNLRDCSSDQLFNQYLQTLTK